MPLEERRARVRRSTDKCNISPQEVNEVFFRMSVLCEKISKQQEAQQKDHDLLMQRTDLYKRFDKLEKKTDHIIEYQDNAKGVAKFVLWFTAVMAALASVAAFIWGKV